jgi:hypothetical protein
VAGEHCPSCGQARIGFFRYCRRCAFDFDTLPRIRSPRPVPWPETTGPGVASLASVAPPYRSPDVPARASTPPRTGRRSLPAGSHRWLRRILLFGLLCEGLLVLAVAAGLITVGRSAGFDQLPPIGSIWFGGTFDSQTFRLSERLTTVPADDGFALLAHLTRSGSDSQLSLMAALDGAEIASQRVASQGYGDAWWAWHGPLGKPGAWTLEIVDPGGSVLASGSVTAQ